MELRNAAEVGQALDRIDARLERIERLLAPIAEVVEVAPGAVATVTDMLDDWSQRDGHVDQRVRGLVQLLTQLTEPVTLSALSNAVQRAAGLRGMLAAFGDAVDDWAARDGQMEQRARGLAALIAVATEPMVLEQLKRAVFQVKSLSGFVAAATDTFDDWAQRDGQVEQRVRGLGALLAAVSEPTMTKRLTEAVEQVSALSGLVATAVDIVDDLAAQAGRAGVSPQELLDTLRKALGEAARFATSSEAKALAKSGMFAPDTLRVLSQVFAAVAEATRHSRPAGFLAAFRASRGQAFQRSIGFAITVATEFGRAIPNIPQPKRLEEGHV